MVATSLRTFRRVLKQSRAPSHGVLIASYSIFRAINFQPDRAAAYGRDASKAHTRSLHTGIYRLRRHTSLGRRRTACLVHRTMATVKSGTPATGPIAEYDERVSSGKLRDDEHQRTIVQSLQDLHDMLADYSAPPVAMPDLHKLDEPKRGFLSSLFHRNSSSSSGSAASVPKNLPKGLYMFGDVGSGKTMLMDLFYDTLPANITSKTRIHFHNFMQDVHKRLHKLRSEHGNDVDVMPLVAAQIASTASVLCFDEFQVTDIADAMILRRLVEMLMRNGSVIVTTSNRHPSDLYKNGIQRESFIPCINLLLTNLTVLNLDSTTDYRKIPRPPSGVYHHPSSDRAAASHADKWFAFLGDPQHDPPHPATHHVWGREITVPKASGRCAWFTFEQLIGRATGAADYLELVREYDAFIVTSVPQMTLRERDWARRFITFVDAVYEGRAKLVLTTDVPLQQLFLSKDEMREVLAQKGGGDAAAGKAGGDKQKPEQHSDERDGEHSDVDSNMRMLMDDLGLSMEMLKGSSIFSGDEEAFAFARALSRLSEMGSQEWVERGMGLEAKGGQMERDSWQRVRSKWREDSM
ncbi:hypothetical protein FH972_025987 [Carpinus fangiana]|uniref:AAA+ ATPase domain-containing protein n=1 Tax=Carpinus fangiana TaxID=176857 RepID=A0A5N6L362_9ROSI|nr:hypothetical protein FH972_025987 [Carpinus fangiana]